MTIINTIKNFQILKIKKWKSKEQRDYQRERCFESLKMESRKLVSEMAHKNTNFLTNFKLFVLLMEMLNKCFRIQPSYISTRNLTLLKSPFQTKRLKFFDSLTNKSNFILKTKERKLSFQMEPKSFFSRMARNSHFSKTRLCRV